MKTMKKLLALMLTLAMVLSMVVPVSAESTGYDIFIKNDAAGHTYEAYQIFAGTLSEDQATLSNVVWGSSVKVNADGSTDLVTALTSDTKEIVTTSGTYTLAAVFSSVATLEKDKQASEVAKILGSFSNDSVLLDRFAEVVGAVKSVTGDNVVHEYLLGAEKTIDAPTVKEIDGKDVKGYELTDLQGGYYLIKDKDGTLEDEHDFYTKYILRVVRDADISVKGEGVTVEKTVNDTIDGTFENTEDANTNDTVYFKLEGSLPDNLSSYDEYYYQFSDKMSKGLTFMRIEQIYVENSNGSVGQTLYDVSESVYTPENYTTKTLLDGVVLEKVSNQEFSLTFADLFDIYSSILPSQKVIVKYSAYLNRNAKINTANVNEVVLEYSNNPNGDGVGKTVSDDAHVFTFKIDIDKYDAADRDTKLPGVTFILYEEDTEGSTIVKHYAKVVTEEMVDNGVEINGVAVTDGDVGLVYGFTEDRNEASILDTNVDNPETPENEKGQIYLKGLDGGIYYLEEIETISGYNKLDTPVQFEIIPTYHTDSSGNVTVTVEYKVDGMTQGNNAVVGVRNSKGATLPTTGGMGTSMLYIAGGALVLCAIVLLITKKRMAAKK